MISFTFSCLFHPFDGNVVLFTAIFSFSIPYLAISQVCVEIFKPGVPRTWFLEITFNARVYVCVCVYAPEAINN